VKRALQKPFARSKYGNRRTVVDGITFASKKEARRWQELKLLRIAKVITGLEQQPRFPIIISGKRVFTYVGDFMYFENGVKVVEDVKGVKTDAFRIKWTLCKTLWPEIDWRIV
jgi:Protein of unknown function (DUF1064)